MSASSCPRATGGARDPDMLDTWFSSALWPFATLGWPERRRSCAPSIGPMCSDRARHPLPLGRANGDDGGRVHRPEPVPRRAVPSVIQAPDGRRMSKSLGTESTRSTRSNVWRRRGSLRTAGDGVGPGRPLHGQGQAGRGPGEQAVERLEPGAARAGTSGGAGGDPVEDRWISPVERHTERADSYTKNFSRRRPRSSSTRRSGRTSATGTWSCQAAALGSDEPVGQCCGARAHAHAPAPVMPFVTEESGPSCPASATCSRFPWAAADEALFDADAEAAVERVRGRRAIRR